jgi:hypothetical protein
MSDHTGKSNGYAGRCHPKALLTSKYFDRGTTSLVWRARPLKLSREALKLGSRNKDVVKDETKKARQGQLYRLEFFGYGS